MYHLKVSSFQERRKSAGIALAMSPRRPQGALRSLSGHVDQRALETGVKGD